jgi:hypothetical protein
MAKIPKRGTFRIPKSNVPYFGQAIGIIKAESFGVLSKPENYTSIPGDVGNATTFNFPVRYEILKGISSKDFVNRKPTSETERKIVEAARELEKGGVRAIGTDCGFTIYFQEEMAKAVSIPVLSSSLLQVPIVSRLLGKGQKVGISTGDSRELSKEHLRRDFRSISELDPQKRLKLIEDRAIYAAKQLISKNPDVGAIVFECTILSPAAAAVQEATGLPVFDAVTLLNWAFGAVVRRRFTGFV